ATPPATKRKANVKSKAPLESIFSSGPLIPTFANVPAAMGCECWNRTTSGLSQNGSKRPIYQPPLYREDRLEVQHALIRKHPLGLLITAGPAGLLANPFPFLVDADGSEKGTL